MLSQEETHLSRSANDREKVLEGRPSNLITCPPEATVQRGDGTPPREQAGRWGKIFPRVRLLGVFDERKRIGRRWRARDSHGRVA